MGATTALCAVVLPLILGGIEDKFGYEYSELILGVVSAIGLLSCIVLYFINEQMKRNRQIDFLNRKIENKKHVQNDTKTENVCEQQQTTDQGTVTQEQQDGEQ